MSQGEKKLNNKYSIKIDKFSLSVFVFLLAVVLIIAPAATNTVVAETMKMKYQAPAVQLHTDGSFTPDTSFLETLGIPQDILLSPHPSFRMDLDEDMKSIGFHEVYFDAEKQKWRVTFSSIIDAPIIDIWGNEPMEINNGLDLSASEDNIKSGTTDTATSTQPMGLPFFYGSESYLLENETDDSGASWEYGTDFLVDSYNILFLDDIGDFSSSNLTVIVSYVENLSYTNLNETYAYNVTIFNEPVDGYSDFWFRLDLENTNSSFDAYVANIELQNFDVRSGRYILDVDANTTDSRYDTNYVGSLSSSVSIQSKDRFQYEIGPDQLRTTNAGPHQQGLQLNGWFDGVTSGEIFSLPSEFSRMTTGTVSEARGWNGADVLEDTIKQSIVDKSDEDKYDDISQIDDLSLTDAIMNWQMGTGLTNALSSVISNAVEIKDSIGGVVNSVAEQIVPRVNFATEVEAPQIADSAAEADDVSDTSTGPVAASNEGSSNWGKNVLDWIGENIVDGAVSVYTGIRDDFDEATGLGKYLPFIVGGVIVAVGVGIYRWRMM